MSVAGRRGGEVEDQPPVEQSRFRSVTRLRGVSDGGGAVSGDDRGVGEMAGGALGSALMVDRAAGPREPGEAVGLDLGEILTGEWSEEAFCPCDFWGPFGQCRAMAVDLLPVAGAVIGGVGQEGRHWCPRHAQMMVEICKVEQQAGRLKPGLDTAYLNLVSARLQHEGAWLGNGRLG